MEAATDALNMVTEFVAGGAEMITHDKAKRKGKKQEAANKERLDEMRAKKKNIDDTNVDRTKQLAKRAAKRSKQKSQTDTGREGTILTDDLGKAGGSIAGTVGGKDLLGL